MSATGDARNKAPVKGMRNVLITSALPYVNNVPHLGNIIGCVLSADVAARYFRSQPNTNVLYVCGTDEYGTATETKAREEGLTPMEICTKYHKIHKEVYDWFEIDFDHFGRTTNPHQAPIAQGIFTRLLERDLVEEQEVEQLFCEASNSFLADRFVEGTCPHCAYEDARGDQCDNCGKLLKPTELINPRSKMHPDAGPPLLKTSQHMFLKLGEMAAQLQESVDDAVARDAWTANAVQITKTWLRDGLNSRCITRDLKWGTAVPMEKFKDKVFYVWFDAPIGYISITASYTDAWREWWGGRDDVELVQFMGKDNVPFHTIMFPGSLLGTGDAWTRLRTLSTTEYLNYETGKFSKSRNTGIFGDTARDTGIPAYAYRYYLLVNRPETSDTAFAWTDFQAKINDELLKNLGNLVNRVLKFIGKNGGGVVPTMDTSVHTDVETALFANVHALLLEYKAAMDKLKIKDGVRLLMKISKEGNLYQQVCKPWEYFKGADGTPLTLATMPAEHRVRAETVMSTLFAFIKTLCPVIAPFMPGLATEILKQANLELPLFSDAIFTDVPAGHTLGTPAPLVRQLTNKEIAALAARFGGDTGAGGKGGAAKNGGGGAGSGAGAPLTLDMRVARIVSATPHEAAEHLFVCSVDVGDAQPRQICGALRAHYTAEQLTGRRVIALCNLPAAQLSGKASEGMLLAAEEKKSKKKDGKKLAKAMGLLVPPADAPLGTRVSVDGATMPEGDVFAPITIDAFRKLKLRTNADGEAVDKTQQRFRIAGEAVVAEPAIKSGLVK